MYNLEIRAGCSGKVIEPMTRSGLHDENKKILHSEMRIYLDCCVSWKEEESGAFVETFVCMLFLFVALNCFEKREMKRRSDT